MKRNILYIIGWLSVFAILIVGAYMVQTSGMTVLSVIVGYISGSIIVLLTNYKKKKN